MNRSKESRCKAIWGGGGGSTMRMVGVWLRQQQYRHVEQANFDRIKYVRSNNIPSMLATTTYRLQQKICIAFHNKNNHNHQNRIPSLPNTKQTNKNIDTHPRRPTQHNTTQHNTTQHNTTQHNTTQHNTTQHNTTQHNATISWASRGSNGSEKIADQQERL